MKVCIVCGQEKPLDQFPTNRGMKDGHLGWCFECFAHRHKFYHYPPPPKLKEEEPEAKRPKLGRPCTLVGRTPEEQALIEYWRRYQREYKKRNREKYLEASRLSTKKYYYSHREKVLTRRKKEYRKRKKEECRQSVRTTSIQSVSTLMKSKA